MGSEGIHFLLAIWIPFQRVLDGLQAILRFVAWVVSTFLPRLAARRHWD